MKTKSVLMLLLPPLCAASVAMAQDVRPDAAMPPAASVAAPATAQVPDQVAPSRPTRRQGGDMRRCLTLKTNKAIIRCAESGRKP